MRPCTDLDIGLLRPRAALRRGLIRRALAGLAGTFALLLTALPIHAQTPTYTSASIPFNWVDSSRHNKLGGSTATPFRFIGASGCGTSPPVIDDALSDAIPIGFTFRFGNTDYTTLRIQTNGRLQFGNTSCGYGTQGIGPPQTYPYGYPDTSMNATMKVFGVDLDPTNLVERPNYPSSTSLTPCASLATCYVSAATVGSAPARQFVVTWKGVPEWVTSTNTSGTFDIQVVLNEDGSFVFQYGAIVHGGTGAAQVGWQLTTTDFQVLTFGASTEPPPNTAIVFFTPKPVAEYRFEEPVWLPGVAGQVLDSTSGARHGSALGGAQATPPGYLCRGASIPANSDAGTVDAVRTGLDLSSKALNLLGTGTVAFWVRTTSDWTQGEDIQLLDATAVKGEWFYLSRTTKNTLFFEVLDSTGVLRSVETAALSFKADTWVHLAVSWNFNGQAAANSDSLTVFVDGVAAATSAFTSSGTVRAQVGTLHLGDNPTGSVGTRGSVRSAAGTFDEVQVYNFAMMAAQVAAIRAASRSCTPTVFERVEIQHASGSGVTCSPSTVTLRACQNAACTALYTGGVAGVLSASGAPATQWDGSTGNATGARFVIPPGSSSVTKSFQVPVAGSVVLGASQFSVGANAATSCNFGSPACTFTTSAAGFLMSVPDHAADTATPLTMRAVRASDNALVCVPAFASTTRPVTLRCSHTNPASGTRPVRIGGTALNAAASATSACDASGQTLNLAFDGSGIATPTLQYADVGRVSVTASFTGTSALETGLSMSGSTSFVARPAGFTLGNVRQTAAPGLANPGATGAGGAAFVRAGESFSATVTAVTSSGAAAPNFGRESPAEGVALTQTLQQPAGGNAGALSGGGVPGASFTNGVATVTSLAFSEVGIITLSAALADGDYLGAGAVPASAGATIGRFVPARFALSGGSVAHRSTLACAPASGFTHLGENFRLGLTLTAQNLAGAATTNYAGAFAKLDPANASAWNLAGVDGATAFTVANGRLALGSASGSFSAGVASGVTLIAQVPRAAAPDGPFNAALGIAPVDADGVALATFDIDTDSAVAGNDRARVANVALRFARLRLQSAAGAADRALALPVLSEYWNGSNFDVNTLDNCTTLPLSTFSFGNLRRSLTPADTTATAPVALSGGRGTLRLSPPGGGRSGSFDVAASLGNAATDASCLQPWTPATGDTATAGANLTHLRGAWCAAAWDKDPAARASFGLPRGHPAWVYRRENH